MYVFGEYESDEQTYQPYIHQAKYKYHFDIHNSER